MALHKKTYSFFMSKTEEQKNPHITHQEGARSHRRRKIADGLPRGCCISAAVNIWFLQ